ncbi:hypothetical protein HHJ74_02810 [Mobiluncus mulieris]|uniref:ABC transporter-associated repeat protein n=2 Tax=Mobiluncus mulieris TaxID=2052 RepID=A0A848RBI7_9ACTO|nr:hypothetical protein [Mobiluncus mulieris]NMW92649.1 hypothetical protein [Mobiluncus mulieris]NMX19638.1 hypothetical protein [Mobiluncus mulieris]
MKLERLTMPKFLLKTAIIAGITLGLLSYGVPLGATAPAAALPVGAGASPDSLDANRDLTDVSEDTTLHLEVGNQTDDPVLTSNPQTTPISAAALSFRAINQDTGVVPQAKLKAEFAAKHPELEYEKLPQWGFANLRISVRASGNQAYNLPARFSIHQTGGNAYLAAYRLRDNTAEPILDNGNGIASKYFVTSQNANYNFSGKDGDIIQLLAVGKGLVTCEVDPIYNPTDENNASFGKTFTLTVNATGKSFADLQPEDLVPPGEQPQTVPNKPGVTQLRQGHMDVFHVDSSAAGGLSLLIKEDITGSGVRRAAESAEMIMGTNWYETGLNWNLPGCENAGFTTASLHSGDMLFPGLSSSDLGSAGFSDVKVEFTSVNAPTGGRIALVLTSSLQGGPQPILEDNHYYIEPGTRLRITTHQHFHWLFTKPGTYQFRAKAIGQLHGQTVESPEVTYTWKTEGQPDNYDPVGIDENCTPHIPNSGATPGAPHESPQKPHADETPGSRPVFDHGHMDVFNVSARNGKLVLETKEDISGSGVIRPPESYFLRLRDNTKYDIPADMQGDLVPSGYLLQENGSNQAEALFPGWDTFGVAPDFTSIDLTFQEVSGPGKAFLFVPGQFNVGINSTLVSGGYELRAGEVIKQSYPAHKHVYWLFAKPGVYTMKVQASGENQSGELVKSNIGTYTWVVGSETSVPAVPPKPGNPKTDKPENTAEPDKPGHDQKPQKPEKPENQTPPVTLEGKSGQSAVPAPTVPNSKRKTPANNQRHGAWKSAKKSSAVPAPTVPNSKRKTPANNQRHGAWKSTKKSSAVHPPSSLRNPQPPRGGSNAPQVTAKGNNSGGNPAASAGSAGFNLGTGFLSPEDSLGTGVTGFTGFSPSSPDTNQTAGILGWPGGTVPDAASSLPAFPGANPSGFPAGLGLPTAPVPLPDQPPAQSPRLESPVAPHEQLSATGESPYGSAVVHEKNGLDPTATFLVGTGIASGLLGFALLASRIPRRFPVLRRH